MVPTSTPPSKKFRTRLLLGGVALLAVVGLAGCATDNTPKAYDTITQQNFVELCTNTLYNSTGEITDIESASSASTLDPALSATDSTIKPDVTAPNEQSCLCMYSVFVQQLPINKAAAQPGYTGQNFTDLNSKMKTDPEEAWASLPATLTDALTACQKGATASTSSTTTSSTTVASTTESTTGSN